VVTSMKNSEPRDFAQLMLMVDGPADCFRGGLLLIVKGRRRDWRWYDAELFDDLDHLKRFACTYLREHYGLASFMMLLCTVDHSGTVHTADPTSN